MLLKFQFEVHPKLSIILKLLNQNISTFKREYKIKYPFYNNKPFQSKYP